MKGFKRIEVASVPSLEVIEIGSSSFSNVNALSLIGLSGLKRVVVGENSLVNREGDFSVRDCASVKEVCIGNGSMKSFRSITVEGVPSLEVVEMGSNSFANVNALSLSGLSGLKRVVVGSSSFSNKNGAFSVVNCTSLESVEIGASSMGLYSALSVDNAPSLEVLSIGSSAFKNVDALRLNGLSKLKRVEINADSFTNKEGVFELKNCASVSELVVGDNGMKSFKSVEIVGVPSLETIRVGDECFANVNEVDLEGLSGLKRMVVGMNSFTLKKNGYGNDPTRGFSLRNCTALTTLEVGRFSFSDYSTCVIEGVNALEAIGIGDLNEKSYNFYAASLELKSGRGCSG